MRPASLSAAIRPRSNGVGRSKTSDMRCWLILLVYRSLFYQSRFCRSLFDRSLVRSVPVRSVAGCVTSLVAIEQLRSKGASRRFAAQDCVTRFLARLRPLGVRFPWLGTRLHSGIGAGRRRKRQTQPNPRSSGPFHPAHSCPTPSSSAPFRRRAVARCCAADLPIYFREFRAGLVRICRA
jgi:hypothetical protein